MKVPPRVTFMCQVVATIWASIVQIAVMNWTLNNIDEVCTPYVMHIFKRERVLTIFGNSTQSGNFTCPNGRAFFSSSIVWGQSALSQGCINILLTSHLGVIGPRRMFGPGGMYAQIQWFWLIGALLPVVFYILIRMRPRSKLRFLNAPV